MQVLGAALPSLVAYVDQRPETGTEDDDVRALEGVAHELAALSPEDQRRLRSLMPEAVADGLGVEEQRHPLVEPVPAHSAYGSRPAGGVDDDEHAAGSSCCRSRSSRPRA